jgi:mono/diheme cytochrome c family protein/glucose/arabinose dehydrogenase
MNKHIWVLTIPSLLFFGCKKDYEEPEVSLESYHIEEGFELSVIAAEPFLEAPVTMDFDNQGRMWVAEMRGYMTNIDGDDEDAPSGTISIMQDLDGDGVTDHSKIFLDGLVLPRALAHVYGGLLYAEPPMLWFVEINEDDTPGKKVLVDSLYADEGNVEHQPNGLMMNIDNWIYNSKSYFRYQRKNGEWLKEPTSYRGQWGISKDNFGRLYYNNNSTLMQGDYVLPNVAINNEYYRPEHSIGKRVTNNQKVYPLHVTSVNRGYQKNVLDADSMLVNVTSACGPLIYRGGQFPSDYDQNGFVCAPEVNIIKRLVLSFDNVITTGEQAWENKEFLASTDEAFRPVNLFNGPDGAMYVVDMHRGIIQHGAYMTPYLRKHLERKGLDKIIGMGRILKITNEQEGLNEIPEIENASTKELIDLLNHKNGWIRDRAQQTLLINGTTKDKAALETTALNNQNSLAQMHALHTLNGLDLLSFNLLTKVIASSEAEVAAHALLLLEASDSTEEIEAVFHLSTQLIDKKDPTIDLYLISTLGRWSVQNPELFVPLLNKLAIQNPDPIFQEAMISSNDNQFIAINLENENQELNKMLATASENRAAERKNWIFERASLAEDNRTRGMRYFKNICAACHGISGSGIEGLAPPLRDSEYLKGPGPAKRLAAIILHGVAGPITVNGKRYEFNAPMPGILNNPDMSDQDITDLISYLNNAFSVSARGVSADVVKALREAKPKSGSNFTEEELLNMNK